MPLDHVHVPLGEWNAEHGSHAFAIPLPYKNVNDEDKRTVNFVRRKMHGLTYQPTNAEHFQTRIVIYPTLFKKSVTQVFEYHLFRTL